MFSFLCDYSGSGSTLEMEEEKARAPRWGGPFLHVVRVVVPLVPLIPSYSPFPFLLFPLDLDPSSPHLPGEERKRSGLIHLLPRRKGDEGPRGIPLLCVALIPATPPTPPPGCVYCCVTRWVACCVLILSVCPPARHPRCVRHLLLRCAIHGTTYDDYPPHLLKD